MIDKHDQKLGGKVSTLPDKSGNVAPSLSDCQKLIERNRRNIKLWGEIAEDGDEGNEPLGAVIRALEKTTDALAAALERKTRKQSTAGMTLSEAMTTQELDNVCLSYRHDFGLLADAEKERIRFQAKEWHRSFTSAIATPSNAASVQWEKEAKAHVIGLRQCSIFAEDAGPSIALQMRQSADFIEETIIDRQ